VEAHMTINHIHLAATDVAATRRFYELYFGFRKDRDHGRGVFLRDGSGFLIALDPALEPAHFPGWFHLGFCQSSEADVLTLYQRAKNTQANIVQDLLAESGQYASFHVADPDGCRIEVSWHAE
jgi:catechol 2,3-dioxygenase-like lactoylglutathione lyase family enzyme